MKSLFAALFFTGITIYAQNYDEIYRPQFHFTPSAHWMNDPNGLVYFNGKFHLFYQYYPEATVWGPMHWGHAVSYDLMHWEQLPIALYPDALGWIFSGSAVIDTQNTAGFGKNAMIAIFTYHNDEIWKSGKKNTESQGIAYSLDEGKTWVKYDKNPVLNNTGEQDFRDPKVFWNLSTQLWNMVLAVGDHIRIFSSPNLKEWKKESDFKPDNDLQNLGVWECPDLFPMTTSEGITKWVMIVNHGDKCPNGGSGTRYFVGDFDGKTFTPSQSSLWMDHGTDFYAAVTFSNVPDNQRILLGWMSNWQYATKVPTEVWRSAMTVPRQLELVASKNQFFLKQSLLPVFQYNQNELYKAIIASLPFEKKRLELEQAEISFATEASDFRITLLNSAKEQFQITFANGVIQTDRSQSGQVGFSAIFGTKIQTMAVPEKITSVQMLLDASSIELLINDGKYSMTNLFFPIQPYSDISITSNSVQKIKNLTINAIPSIWKK
ncbi:glycoside hydrolase family 32 protein [Flavobacterium sp. N1719]|uniref:glycoside hydrolase family 32 protein n=1 Tax=Flavobacterium sp. N1719 TaxID=2885633 RepID=UPI0022219AF6|nr:glycoside hydrolase family 32 protein [Flavobacterium sp. N1719]